MSLEIFGSFGGLDMLRSRIERFGLVRYFLVLNGEIKRVR